MIDQYVKFLRDPVCSEICIENCPNYIYIGLCIEVRESRGCVLTCKGHDYECWKFNENFIRMNVVIDEPNLHVKCPIDTLCTIE